MYYQFPLCGCCWCEKRDSAHRTQFPSTHEQVNWINLNGTNFPFLSLVVHRTHYHSDEWFSICLVEKPQTLGSSIIFYLFSVCFSLSLSLLWFVYFIKLYKTGMRALEVQGEQLMIEMLLTSKSNQAKCNISLFRFDRMESTINLSVVSTVCPHWRPPPPTTTMTIATATATLRLKCIQSIEST